VTDDVISHLEVTGPADDPTYTTRTETLRTAQARCHIDNRFLVDSEHAEEAWRLAVCDLKYRLSQLVEKGGRLVVGEATLEKHEDHLRDQTVVTLTVKTRQSDVGEWASIWAAIREDGWT
jgi:hypothetical protein